MKLNLPLKLYPKDNYQDILLITLLIFAPLSYGMVHTWAETVFSVIAATIFILQYFKSYDSLKENCALPAVRWGAFFLAVVILQVIPLPQNIIEFLSPSTAKLYGRYSPDGADSGVLHTLSVYRWATMDSLSRLIAFGMIFLAIIGRAGKRPEGASTEIYMRRHAYMVMGFLTGIFAILLHSLTDFNLHIPANGLYFTVIVALTMTMLRDKERIDFEFIKKLSDIIIVIAFLIAVFGIIQKFSFNGKVFWVGYSVKKTGAVPFGPYINRNHYAGYMEMCIPIALAAFAARLRTSSFFHIEGLKEKISWLSSEEAAKAIFSLFCAIVMTGSLFLCASRSGITSFVITTSVFLLTVMSRVSKKRRAFFGFALGVLVMLMIAMILWMGTQLYIQRFAMLAKLKTSPEPRMYFWQGTINMIRDFPLFGTGLGTFSSIFPKYSDPSFKLFERYKVLYPENDYLQTVSDMGMAGLFLIVLFVAYFVRSYVRISREIE